MATVVYRQMTRSSVVWMVGDDGLLRRYVVLSILPPVCYLPVPALEDECTRFAQSVSAARLFAMQ
jgi:hypothetical protein